MDRKSRPTRYFKIVVDSITPKINNVNVEPGRYNGTSPMQAARKVCSYLHRLYPLGVDEYYYFSIIETTHKSKKMKFPYKGTMVDKINDEIKEIRPGIHLTRYPKVYTTRNKG